MSLCDFVIQTMYCLVTENRNTDTENTIKWFTITVQPFLFNYLVRCY